MGRWDARSVKTDVNTITLIQLLLHPPGRVVDKITVLRRDVHQADGKESKESKQRQEEHSYISSGSGSVWQVTTTLVGTRLTAGQELWVSAEMNPCVWHLALMMEERDEIKVRLDLKTQRPAVFSSKEKAETCQRRRWADVQ